MLAGDNGASILMTVVERIASLATPGLAGKVQTQNRAILEDHEGGKSHEDDREQGRKSIAARGT
ncbi:1fcb9059-fa51-4d59-af9e-3b8d21f07b6d [Thermothielavioides terrestris]|uniref:1fcb9059-fa51-4d59-af9e-3b8d21f07b6d n=1 Tax=Thermothielavioides terrestris TaxID=2587410 RepID=A0A3S4DAU6_9PEZI|nr:1fcb9059-fa51-4d59-af9e-3b8d21f07b6d [Thermothielavioides terrestris]